jgi:DNA gyrase subunit B
VTGGRRRRGIPTDIVAKTGKSALETVYTLLHAGANSAKAAATKWRRTPRRRRLGRQRLSEWLEINVYRDGKEHFIRFENGGKCLNPIKYVGPTERRGTTVTFKPDATIFTETVEFSYE